MVNLRTYSFDKETIKILEQESNELHIGKSAFLRLLIWKYHNNKKSSNGGKTAIAE